MWNLSITNAIIGDSSATSIIETSVITPVVALAFAVVPGVRGTISVELICVVDEVIVEDGATASLVQKETVV
jgi:hypothetical protein